MSDLRLPPASDGDRGGADANRHDATLDAATVKGEDSWAREERERRQRDAAAFEQLEVRRRRVASLMAGASAQMAQARSEAVSSAATVGIAGLSGLLLIGGPAGAVAGIAAGWLYDRFFNDGGAL